MKVFKAFPRPEFNPIKVEITFETAEEWYAFKRALEYYQHRTTDGAYEKAIRALRAGLGLGDA